MKVALVLARSLLRCS